MKKKGYISQADALKKLQRYCAYQDRCHQEVRNKLNDLGLYGESREQVVADLIQENFLNEERFARSYARGKFRMKKWGRNRIRQELRKRAISDYCIRKAMEEIEQPIYEQTLREVLQKRFDGKTNLVKPYERRQDMIRYGLRRGFENTLIVQIATKIIQETFGSY